MKVLNELGRGITATRGLYRFASSHDPSTSCGAFGNFKETYLASMARNWKKRPRGCATVTKSSFARAYAEQFSTSSEEAMKVIGEAKPSTALSIEGFANRVKGVTSTPASRLPASTSLWRGGPVFIGQDAQAACLNLQRWWKAWRQPQGRASVFVTFPAGRGGESWAREKVRQADESSARSRAASAPSSPWPAPIVQEVIQRRPAWKRIRLEPDELIPDLWGGEGQPPDPVPASANNSLQLKAGPICQAFCGLYPFHPYQLETCSSRRLQSLAVHNVGSGAATWRWVNARCSRVPGVAGDHGICRSGHSPAFDQLLNVRHPRCDAWRQARRTMVLRERQGGAV